MKFRNVAGACVLAAAFLLGFPAAGAQAATALGSDPYQPGYGNQPAWMQQLNAQMATAHELGDVSDILRNSSGRSGVSSPTPGGGSGMDGLLNGMNYSGQVSNDVYGYEQGVREPNGHYEY
ncbi:hypothetical protein [Actinoplanes regularis]|uniref:hypothetical protein n=1 Tax=Actinoplanes regularis TaxID=52697 RepID=UPI0024A17B2B|nr:hypothetical protein [Actinoplanes regularis]GLW29247.1 hypothetical protein Areg01_21870 [Actinoplanes regularis]